MGIDDLTIRPLVSAGDLEACVAMQRATWGDAFREVVPPAILQVSQKIGGIVAGAFDGDRLVGFVYGLSGFKDGAPAHWSHMLAVDPAYRDGGIGRRLKFYQRDLLLAAGIQHMYWTFDPLVARNAHLNLNRLGVSVVEYVEGMYGNDPESSMDAVIGTDRFVVLWHMAEAAAAAGTAASSVTPVVAPETPDLPDAPRVQVAIPGDIHAVKAHDPAEARTWRAVTRSAFQHYLPRGYTVRGITRDPGTDRSLYLLTSHA
ncbi:MAG TPA: GNAT family N-acetyltransferase [Gemmatimonadales bacterium]